MSGQLHAPGSFNSGKILKVIKSRVMRWAGHVVRMGEERGGI